jgi:acyl-CoA thioesterase-1
MKICALGDSIFAGYLVGGRSLIYYLQKDGYDIDNFGVNGLTSIELLHQVTNTRDLKKYDAFIIHIGLNDFLNGVSIDEVEENIIEILKIIIKNNPKIFLCSPYKIGLDTVSDALGYFESFNSTNKKLFYLDDFYKALDSKNYIKLISFYELSKEGEFGKHLLDGIHPDEEFHQLLAQHVKEAIDGFL